MKPNNIIYFRESSNEPTISDVSKKAQDKLIIGVLAALKIYKREIFAMSIKRGIQAKKERYKSKLK